MRPVAGAYERESGSLFGQCLVAAGQSLSLWKSASRLLRCRSKQVLIDFSSRVFDAGSVVPRKQGSS